MSLIRHNFLSSRLLKNNQTFRFQPTKTNFCQKVNVDVKRSNQFRRLAVTTTNTSDTKKPKATNLKQIFFGKQGAKQLCPPLCLSA